MLCVMQIIVLMEVTFLRFYVWYRDVAGRAFFIPNIFWQHYTGKGEREREFVSESLKKDSDILFYEVVYRKDATLVVAIYRFVQRDQVVIFFLNNFWILMIHTIIVNPFNNKYSSFFLGRTCDDVICDEVYCDDGMPAPIVTP